MWELITTLVVLLLPPIIQYIREKALRIDKDREDQVRQFIIEALEYVEEFKNMMRKQNPTFRMSSEDQILKALTYFKTMHKSVYDKLGETKLRMLFMSLLPKTRIYLNGGIQK